MKTDQSLPIPFVSYGFALTCVLVYLAQLAAGVDWLSPAPDHMIAWGANQATHTLLGEPWRLLTSMFLHVGIIHLALNMYMLVMFGPVVEDWFGAPRFALIYVISGLGGSLASALYHAHGGEAVNAAGASGALMGIAGALLGNTLVASARGDDHEKISMRGPLAQTIGINLLIGLFLPAVDNACHIGGLVLGAALGVALTWAEFDTHVVRRLVATVVISAAGLLLIGWGLKLPPSAGLRKLAAEQAAEQVRAQRASQRAAQAAALAAEIARDRKNRPAPVSLAVAAGQWVPLQQWTENLVLGPTGARIYVSGSMDNALKVIDANSARVVQTISPGAFPARDGPVCHTCDGRGATGVALNTAETRAYVTSMARDRVAIIDLKKNAIVASVATGKFPNAIAVAAADDRAYAFSTEAGVVAFDVATRKVVARSAPFCGENHYWDHKSTTARVWLAARDREVWTWDHHARGLRVFEANSLRELAPVALTANHTRAVELSARLGTAWVLGEDRFEIVDLARRRVTVRIALCRPVSPAAMAVSGDGQLLAVAEEGSGFVRVVKMRTLQTLGVYPLRGEASGLRFSPDGKRLYAISNRAMGLSILDLTKSARIDTWSAEWPDFFCTGVQQRIAQAMRR